MRNDNSKQGLRRRGSAAAAILALATVAHAGPIYPLAGLSSTGADGSFTAVLTSNAPYYGTSYVLNTDTGQLLAGGYASNGYLEYSSGPLATFTPRLVAQSNGPEVNVFDFSSFGVPQGYTLTTTGDTPAALLSLADAQVAGSIIVRNANQPGATSPGVSIGALGGGNGGNGWGYVDANTYGFAGSGGGGGLVSQGESGDPGVPQIVGYDPYYPLGPQVYWPVGGFGGSAADLSIFEGGGGGGLGGYACGYCGGVAAGGYGGGALLFGDTSSFTVTSTGSIIDNGGAGQLNSDGPAGGAGGGGAGGDLWFIIGGAWENEGAVSAQGGAGAIDNGSTYSNYTSSWWNGPFVGGNGSGGFVNIDAANIINNGVINVSGGGGGNTGLVDLSSPLTGDGAIYGSTTPEPGSLFLTALPVLWMLKRRGKRT